MTTISTLIFYAGLTLMALSIWMLLRNRRVYNFRSGLIRRVHVLCQEDIRRGSGMEFMRRYDEFDRVSYDKMMWSMKRLRVENFWADDSFLRGDPDV